MDLTISQLIKIILGVLVIVMVVSGIYFFGNYISDFMGNLPGGNLSKWTKKLFYLQKKHWR